LVERGDAVVIADGHSCREMARQGAGYTLMSLPGILVNSRSH